MDNETIKTELRMYLNNTDYIITQYHEETQLNIPHKRSEEEYLEILKTRQQKRDELRNLSSSTPKNVTDTELMGLNKE